MISQKGISILIFLEYEGIMFYTYVKISFYKIL